MSSTDKSSVKKYIEEWSKLKASIASQEKEMEKYKSKVIEYMNKNEIETLVADDFIVKSSKCNRESISKSDLPSEIWKKYCKSSSYYVYKLEQK